MSSSKTAGVLIAEMMMLRSGGHRGVFSLVEGPDDLRFWKQYLKIPVEGIVVAEGVINLRGCMKNLPATLAGSVIAIADKDYSDYLIPNPFDGCVDTFFYDEGYLETFLINSPALQKIIRLYASEERLAAFRGQNEGLTVFAYARRVGAMFGKLRILNAKQELGLCFVKRFTPYRYLCPKSWKFAHERLLADFAMDAGWTMQQLDARLQELEGSSNLHVCHGHDMIKVLVVGLKAPLGSAKVGEDSIAKDLTLAFEFAGLKYKRLYKSMKAWAMGRKLI